MEGKIGLGKLVPNREKERKIAERKQRNKEPLERRESRIIYSLQTSQNKAEPDKAMRYTYPTISRFLNPFFRPPFN